MEEKRSMDDQFLSTIKEIIGENLDNEHFSVEEMAQKAGLSRSMLHRRLKKLTGKSASDLITEYRLLHARQLLEDNVATVSEVAYQTGFSSPSYFAKVFQKHFGESPGHLRKKNVTRSITETVSLEEENDLPETKPASKNKIRQIAIAASILVVLVFVVFLLMGSRPSEKSVAVLPFDNLTGSADYDYFADGLQDAIIGELGRVRSLRVISRTSTLRYRNSKMLMKDIATELGVNTLVEGSVLAAGDSLRVLIQLIKVFPEERHLLSGDYRDEMRDVLAVQTQAAREISDRIGVKKSAGEEALLNRKRTVDPETYKDYLRGMYDLNKGTDSSFDSGMKHLENAIDRDPGDPLAYAGLALGYATLGHGSLSAEEAFGRAITAAGKALNIDPNQDEAHLALAMLHLYDDWNWEAARRSFETAIAKNPSNEIAHAHYAWYHILFGDMKNSIEEGRKAVMIEPMSASYQSWLAWLYLYDGDVENAELWAQRSVDLQKDLAYGNLVLAWTYMLKKDYPKAISILQNIPDSDPVAKKFYLGYVYLKSGKKEKALALWREVEQYAEGREVNTCLMGLMAGYLGFNDRAFELLDQAYQHKLFPVSYINVFGGTEYLVHDPRYAELMKKMNLPDRKTIFPLEP